jgi:polyisoprenoid-binding protein YceI
LKYRFLADKSELSFELPTSLHLAEGKVGAWKGQVTVDPGEPGIVHASLEIDARSLETGSKGRDEDMHGKVLESDKFPAILFRAGRYRGDLGDFSPGRTVTVELDGELEIHGVTKPVQASLECRVFSDHVSVAGSVPLRWKEYGLRDMSKLLLRIHDPMKVNFRLWAVPEVEGGSS